MIAQQTAVMESEHDSIREKAKEKEMAAIASFGSLDSYLSLSLGGPNTEHCI